MTQRQDESHGAVRHVADQVTDAVAAVAGRLNAKMIGSAEAFVHNAGVSDLYEIQAANLVLERSPSPPIRSAAERMLEDHTHSSKQLRLAIGQSYVKEKTSLPAELDARREKMLDHLRSAPEDKFEKTYVEQQVLAHQEAVTLMTEYRDRGDDESLRRFAAETAPVIEEHLGQMKALRKNMA